MGFRQFEEIAAWQTARKIVRSTYHISNEGALGRDFGLRDQMRRAAVSIMSNISEGFSRRSGREFARYLSMAKGSTAELQS